MNKKRLNLIFILCVLAVLLVVGILGVKRSNRVVSDTPVVIEEAVVDVVDVLTETVTPAPTATPELPDYAVTLLVDRKPVLTLSSEPETHRLLWEYLTESAVAPEGETFVSARFARELIIAKPEPDAVVATLEEAKELLRNMPELVPVRVETLRTEIAESEIERVETEEKALAKGSRIITQLGAGGVIETRTPATYVAQKLDRTGAPQVITLREPRATIYQIGSYDVRDKSGEPDKNRGEKGKPAGELRLHVPMRGNVISRYGFREGSMHNGLDIENKAGTAVTAPAEGVVVYCGERGAYGYVVDIDHGNGFVSRLTHLENVALEYNQRVFADDEIGTLADNSTEQRKPHLHYELIIDNVPYNPEFYLS